MNKLHYTLLALAIVVISAAGILAAPHLYGGIASVFPQGIQIGPMTISPDGTITQASLDAIGGINASQANITTLYTKNHLAYYGMKCDGVTDDTQAVQKAMDSGDTHFISPEGVCIVNYANITKSGVTIEGIKNQSIWKNSKYVECILCSEGNSDITLKGLKFIGIDSASRANYLFSSVGGNNVKVEDCIFDQLRTLNNGLKIYSVSTDLIGVVIRDTVVRQYGGNSGGTRGVTIGASSNDLYDILIDNLHVSGFSDGFDYYATGMGYNGVITNSIFENSRKYGIDLYHFGDIIFTNNVLRNNEVGANFDNSATTWDSLISNNKFYNNTVAGFTAEEWDRVVFSNNKLYQNGYGAFLFSGRNVDLTGNQFYNNSKSGVLIDAEGNISNYYARNQILIYNLNFNGNRFTANGHHGVILSGVAGETRFDNCDFTRNGLANNESTIYAGLLIRKDSSGTINELVKVTDSTFGNVNTVLTTRTGQQKYGILVNESDDARVLLVSDSDFIDIHTAVSGASGDKIFKDNHYRNVTYFGDFPTDNVNTGLTFGKSYYDTYTHYVKKMTVTTSNPKFKINWTGGAYTRLAVNIDAMGVDNTGDTTVKRFTAMYGLDEDGTPRPTIGDKTLTYNSSFTLRGYKITPDSPDNLDFNLTLSNVSDEWMAILNFTDWSFPRITVEVVGNMNVNLCRYGEC